MTWYVLYGENGEILMKTQDKDVHENLVEAAKEPVTDWDGKLRLQTTEQPQSVSAAQEIARLKAELSALDYKQFKHLRGELSADEWIAVKAEIQSRTARINELETML